MAAVTVAQLNRDGVLHVLATLYANPIEAQQLLYRLGADQTRLPHFGGSQTPFSTWFEVCRLIENGAFRFTLEDLLTEAAQDFPGNAVLRSVTAGLGPHRPNQPSWPRRTTSRRPRRTTSRSSACSPVRRRRRGSNCAWSTAPSRRPPGEDASAPSTSGCRRRPGDRT